ncbi:MAG: acetyl-coenzyme A synthetase N-terminal domain-containing protein, partial [Tepidisphaeraceae bacterium]
MDESQPNIVSSLQENRLFPPDPAFSAAAHIKSRADYDRLYQRSIEEPEAFWSDVARELHWFSPWSKTLDWNLPFAKWFVGGKTNVAYNCLDRQVTAGRGNKPAIIWEGEPETSPGKGGRLRTVTYSQLKDDVCKF